MQQPCLVSIGSHAILSIATAELYEITLPCVQSTEKHVGEQIEMRLIEHREPKHRVY